MRLCLPWPANYYYWPHDVPHKVNELRRHSLNQTIIAWCLAVPGLKSAVKVGGLGVAQQIGNFLSRQVGLTQVFSGHSHTHLVMNLLERCTLIAKTTAQGAITHIELSRDFLWCGYPAGKIDNQLAHLVYQPLLLVQSLQDGIALLLAQLGSEFIGHGQGMIEKLRR